MRTVVFFNTASTISATAATNETFSSPPADVQLSPWHSPVPYLFGGLAAMLGLIAFALLVLACSYWKLSRRINSNAPEGNADRDLEATSGVEKDKSESMREASPVLEEKILVIMAGDVKPTFLATPLCSNGRAALVEDGNFKTETNMNNEKAEMTIKPIGDIGHHEQTLAEVSVSADNRATVWIHE